MKEEWRDVVGYEGLYKASNYGVIKSVRRNRVMVPTKQGSPNVTLTKGGKSTLMRVSQLVAESFMGPCPVGLVLCYIDGNRRNTNYENLYYGTASDRLADVRARKRREAVNEPKPIKPAKPKPLDQASLMRFDPGSGERRPYPSHAGQWREYHGELAAWLFNPWTGERRLSPDVGSDPLGHLIVPGSGK